jgi:hypothetical protein
MSDEDQSQEEASQFDPDTLLMDELDRRRDLDRATTEAAEVMLELSTHRGLYRYVLLVRKRAAMALSDLIDASVTDPVYIARLQAHVRAYVDVCRFIDDTLRAAKDAEGIIKQEYGDGPFDD